jgi:hypothetical protein
MPASQLTRFQVLRAGNHVDKRSHGRLVIARLVGSETVRFVLSVGVRLDSRIGTEGEPLLARSKRQLLASSNGRVASPDLRGGAHVLRHSRVAWCPSKCGCGGGRCVQHPRHHRAWVNGLAARCTASCRRNSGVEANLTRRSNLTRCSNRRESGMNTPKTQRTRTPVDTASLRSASHRST